MFIRHFIFFVMSDIFISREVMLCTWSSVISSILLSSALSGLNVVASILLTVIYSILLLKDVGILEIFFSCKINRDEIFTDVSLSTSVASDIQSVHVLRGTSYF